jgi:outer membrane biosynthesis protein TonB
MGSVRRRFAYVLVWALATAITVSGSWLGIRSMLAAGGAQRSTPLSAADLREVAQTPTPSPTPPPRPTPTRKPKPTATKKPPPSKSARTPTPRPTETWQPVSDGRPGQAFQRRFKVRGGEALVQINENEVRVLEVEPARGYQPDVNQDGSTTVRISFESPAHNSRILVIWRDDRPYSEITETA